MYPHLEEKLDVIDYKRCSYILLGSSHLHLRYTIILMGLVRMILKSQLIGLCPRSTASIDITKSLKCYCCQELYFGYHSYIMTYLIRCIYLCRFIIIFRTEKELEARISVEHNKCRQLKIRNRDNCTMDRDFSQTIYLNSFEFLFLFLCSEKSTPNNKGAMLSTRLNKGVFLK